MCMKYVNAAIECFLSVREEKGCPIVFINPFDEILSNKKEDGKFYLPDFKLITNINIIGTADQIKQTDHILYRDGGKLDFIIRLTKCHRDINRRIYYDLDSFSLDIKSLRKSDQMDMACFDFVNYARKTNVLSFGLKENGPYVIKLLIKDEKQGDDEYSVQFMKRLDVR